MQRDRQLDDAQPCAEVTAGDRNGVNRLLTQLVGDLTKLRLVKPTKIGGRSDLVEQGRLGIGHTRLHALKPALKGPGRRKIYRALHQKNAGAQKKLYPGAATVSAKPLIPNRSWD